MKCTFFQDFLSDYGMVWVGTADTEGEMSSEYDEISSPGEEVSRSTGMWRPGEWINNNNNYQFFYKLFAHPEGVSKRFQQCYPWSLGLKGTRCLGRVGL